MTTIPISIENARKAFDKASKSEKELLKNLLGEDVLKPKNIMERVLSYEAACDVLAIDPVATLPKNSEDWQIAEAKLVIIIRALNEGWTPDWNDGNQPKYYPWFKVVNGGSGLSYDDCNCTLSTTDVGSRLLFKSEELCKYAATQFKDLYETYYLIK